MLSRFLIPPLKTTSHHLRFLTTLVSSNKSLPPPTPPIQTNPARFFSTNRRGGGKDDTTHNTPWKITPDNDDDDDDIFKEEDGSGDFGKFPNEIGSRRANVGSVDSWNTTSDSKNGGDVFGDIDKEFDSKKSVGFGGFPNETGIRSRRSNVANVESWSTNETKISGGGQDVFGDIDKEFEGKETGGKGGGGGDDEWVTAQGLKGWSFGDDDKINDIFDIGGEDVGIDTLSSEIEDDRNAKNEAQQELELEKKQLLLQLKGPNRAFGDLIAAAGITDAMLDSLIALKDLEGVEGLSPLSEIEDSNSGKSQKSYTRAEIERRKQDEIDKSRVRRVDEKGRAYGTGRRKCSVARVWIEPGDGKFLVNDKQFDVYFPIIDHRADLLRPFCETKTLGLWDVKCTVKGGGVSGQVGAVRLGISRALQNWEPGLRSDLKAVGFLTRDPRMVERKKPGKAKARKSFQWVKR